MEKRMTQSHMDDVLVLLLTGIFAACLLLVLLSGANSYRKLTERDTASYQRRICCAYVAAKVRHADTADCVWVGNFAGTASEEGDTLILAEQVDGVTYWTRIYEYDGWVRELYCAEGDSFSPGDGEPVLEAQSLRFALQSGLLTVWSADSSGDPAELSLALRSGGGASA